LDRGVAREAKIPWVVRVIRRAQLEIELALRRYHESWHIRKCRNGTTPIYEVKSGKAWKLAVKVKEIRMMLLREFEPSFRILETLHTKVRSDGMQHVHKELRGEFVVLDY
jgi:hypothetical protein